MSEWYYMSGGRQNGPISADQLKSLAANGGVQPDDLVWNQSMTEWVAANRVRGLSFVGQPASGEPLGGYASAPAASPAPQHYSATAPQYAAPAMQAPPGYSAPGPAYQQQPGYGAAPLSYSRPGDDGSTISHVTLEMLRQTRPWVLFLSVLMFIGSGLCILFGIGTMVQASSNSYMSSRATSQAMVTMVILFAEGVLIFFPALFLVKYASAISALSMSRRTVDLENAMKAQKSYWLFTGVMTLIGIVLMIVAVMIAVASS